MLKKSSWSLVNYTLKFANYLVGLVSRVGTGSGRTCNLGYGSGQYHSGSTFHNTEDKCTLRMYARIILKWAAVLDLSKCKINSCSLIILLFKVNTHINGSRYRWILRLIVFFQQRIRCETWMKKFLCELSLHSLKGLSHEIDFKNVDNNFQN